MFTFLLKTTSLAIKAMTCLIKRKLSTGVFASMMDMYCILAIDIMLSISQYVYVCVCMCVCVCVCKAVASIINIKLNVNVTGYIIFIKNFLFCVFKRNVGLFPFQ